MRLNGPNTPTETRCRLRDARVRIELLLLAAILGAGPSVQAMGASLAPDLARVGTGAQVGAALQSPGPPTSRRIVGYFPTWARNSGYSERDIDFATVNVVAHFAVVPRGDGSIEVPDWGPFPDLELVAATHGAGARIVLVVGGDHEAATVGFSAMASSPVARQRFVNDLLAIVATYQYDGVDLDWEFPASAADRANLTALVTELRSALPPDKTLSLAGPASHPDARWYDLRAMVPHLDWLGAMSYSLHTSPEPDHAGHNAPLLSPSEDRAFHSGQSDNLSLDSVIKYYLARGVPAHKLLLGVPFFGQRFDDASALHEPMPSSANAALGYAEIAPLIGNGWTRSVDASAGVPYLLRDDGPGLISYDDPASVATKCEFIKARRLGGVIIWHLGQDRRDRRQPLLESIRACTNRLGAHPELPGRQRRSYRR